MADAAQLAVLRQGREAWNAWREQNPDIRVDLADANLAGADLGAPWDLTGADLLRAGANLISANLSGANLSGANLRGAKLVSANLQAAVLSGANLIRANLNDAILQKANLTGAKLFKAALSQAYVSKADFTGADLTQATLTGASLSHARLFRANLTLALLGGAGLYEANLRKANLTSAYLMGAGLLCADFTGANLREADLTSAGLVQTNFTAADLTGCRVYGISAWDLKLDRAVQKNLIITPRGEPEITVDNLEVAQFIYLLLNNERIRHVIDTITSKVVLILGRFTNERKAVLDALKEELRQRKYLPVLFDFDKPASRTTVETVSTLAHMARFVIADLTDAKSVLQELQAIVPTNPSVPMQPLILGTEAEPEMFDFFRAYRWMLEPYRYQDLTRLLATLTDRVIVPVEAKVLELRGVSPPT
jgi:uncharacterized protein YjbI with pentapeptide repeats